MSKSKVKNQIKSIIMINNELKRRLKLAVKMIEDIKKEKRMIQRNLKRAGDAVYERDETIKKLEGQLQDLRKRLTDVDAVRANLKAANASLKDQVNASMEDVERKSHELEAFKKQSADSITLVKRNHAEETGIMEMHIAGLQAQITEMREKHPGSALLRDSGERFADGRPKTVLRTIYDGAWGNKGKSLGITDPMKMQVKVE